MLRLSTRTVLGAALASTLVLLGASTALAGGPHRFTVRNVGSHSIASVYLSDVDLNSWGPDQLGDYGTIDPGYKYTWAWDGDCLQDVKVVFDNGRSMTERAYDTCTYDLRVSY